MKNYVVRTRRVAHFLYNINAENIEQAEHAALAMMDSEQYVDHNVIDYDHEIDKSGEFDEKNPDFDWPNDYGIMADKVVNLYGDGSEGSGCEAVWDYISAAYEGKNVSTGA